METKNKALIGFITGVVLTTLILILSSNLEIGGLAIPILLILNLAAVIITAVCFVFYVKQIIKERNKFLTWLISTIVFGIILLVSYAIVAQSTPGGEDALEHALLLGVYLIYFIITTIANLIMIIVAKKNKFS